MSKYLELFKGAFDDSIGTKTKLENKPYIGYSLTDGKLAYTVVPKLQPDNEIWYYTLDGKLSHPNNGMIGYPGLEGAVVDPFNATIVSNSQILEPAEGGGEQHKGIIKLADKLTKINSLAYIGNSNIADVYLPNSLLEIGGQAFADSSLIEINLPSSITRIGARAFGSCSNLSRIIFNGTSDQWNSVIKEYEWCIGCSVYLEGVFCTKDGVMVPATYEDAPLLPM